jgi:hypothetical protein
MFVQNSLVEPVTCDFSGQVPNPKLPLVSHPKEHMALLSVPDNQRIPCRNSMLPKAVSAKIMTLKCLVNALGRDLTSFNPNCAAEGVPFPLHTWKLQGTRH